MSSPGLSAPRNLSFRLQWLRELIPHTFHETPTDHAKRSSLAMQLLSEDWLMRDSVAPNLGLLILNHASDISKPEILESPDAPLVVAIQDEAEPSEHRSAVYSRLASCQYRYAGAEGGCALWTRLSAIPCYEPKAQVLEPLTPTAQTDNVYFETGSSGEITAAGRLDLKIIGWAFTDLQQPIPPFVYLQCENLRTGAKTYIPGMRVPRPDVAAHFGHSGLLMSGFEATLPIQQAFPNGLRLRVFQSDGEHIFEGRASAIVHRGAEDFEKSARVGVANKFLRGAGVEIGALQKKLPLPPGCSVRYIDRMSLPSLFQHYPELEGLPLQAPDIIDDGEALHSITEKSLDFVVANHFFEHCENPIQALHNLLRLLRRYGILYLAVPDKRYTFDSERPATDFEVLDRTYTTGIRRDRESLFHEWVRFVELNRTDAAGQRAAELLSTNYSIHYNVWSADDLLTFLIRARHQFQLTFNICSSVCVDNEIIVLLEQTA